MNNTHTLKEITLSYMLMNIMNNNNLINLKNKSNPMINIDLDISDIDLKMDMKMKKI